MHIRFVFFLLFCFCSWTGVAQNAVKKLKSDAEQYYAHEKYREALNLFLKYQRVKSTDAKTRFKIGRCYLETNRTEEAYQYFESLIEEEKKPPLEAYYYAAKSYHRAHQFKKAIEWYKKFLAVTSKKGHQMRDASKDALRRCVNGMNQINPGQQVIVENLGELVNTSGDDFAPILSPNFDGRIYFSSSRVDNVGGLRLPDGTKDHIFGEYKTDMFTSSVVNGQWGGTKLLNPLINSSKNDVVLGFSSNGFVLHYYKGISLFSGETFVDTFGTETTPLQQPYFYSPAIAENGDVDPFFFNDTTLLFSSDREGGYGGKDLYISFSKNGQWTKPANLGSVINSPYDEVTPFLAIDGRTLYFSSNNLRSMGDLDIFRTRFNDGLGTWSVPENLGMPFNSAGEDAYFKLSKDGMKAFFSSSRKESQGKRDIYIGYFSISRGEQRGSKPALFTEVLAAGKQEGTNFVDLTPTNGGWVSTDFSSSQETENYELTNLYFDSNGAILTKDNKLTLEDVAILLKRHPAVKLELVSHTDPSGQAKFDLYFSAKRAQEVMTYLLGKGVNPDGVFVRGCGASYPVAKNETESGASDIGRKLNRRIELVFHRISGLPIQLTIVNEKVPSFLQTDHWQAYNQTIKGLSYKIQIADIKQMYNGDLLTRLPNATIETSGQKDSYQYTIGLFQNFSSANQLQLELVRQGIQDAYVVPYIDGLRANLADSKIFATAYPDLYNYLRSVEE